MQLSFKNNVSKEALSSSLYLLAFTAIIITHRIAPTDLNGPGLDVLVYGITLFINLFWIAKNTSRYFDGDQSVKWICVVDTLALLTLMLLFVI